MTEFLRACYLATVVVVIAVPARADEQAEARKIIDKAIKAHGGADALGKQPATTTKFKGRYFGMGEGIDFTGSSAEQAPDRFRFEVSMTIANQPFSIVQALNGEKAWMSFNGKAMDLGKEHVVEMREGAHLHQVGRLVCLSGKEFKLSTLGEVKIDKRPTVGVQVQYAGRRDINLYFDKESGFIVKTETRSKDPAVGDQEFTLEMYHREYKKYGNVMVPQKVEIRHDGKLFVESETVEHTQSDKLDDALFTKP